MLTVEKCKWKYDKQSPVVIMMDDLCNKFMVAKDNSRKYENDWGGYCKGNDSWYRFVYDNIFKDYPYARMTCFLVTGRREDLIEGNLAKRNVSLRIDETDEFKDFLIDIINDEHFEIAYHGFTHGKCSSDGTAKGFVQEWRSYRDLNEALQTIDKGISLYHNVTGKSFNGGKYCGYATNEFSDESIALSRFDYWCYSTEGIDYSKHDGKRDISFMGDIVDFPTTVDGHLFSLKLVRHMFSKEYIRSLYYLLKKKTTLERCLDKLVTNGQVVSIQSHTSPIREDNRRQYPNIVDDIDNVRYIFRYLKKYDLWYATCDEISDYYRSYMGIDVTTDGKRIEIIPKMDRKHGNIWIKIGGLDHEKKWKLVRGAKEYMLMESKTQYIVEIPTERAVYDVCEQN